MKFEKNAFSFFSLSSFMEFFRASIKSFNDDSLSFFL